MFWTVALTSCSKHSSPDAGQPLRRVLQGVGFAFCCSFALLPRPQAAQLLCLCSGRSPLPPVARTALRRQASRCGDSALAVVLSSSLSPRPQAAQLFWCVLHSHLHHLYNAQLPGDRPVAAVNCFRHTASGFFPGLFAGVSAVCLSGSLFRFIRGLADTRRATQRSHPSAPATARREPVRGCMAMVLYADTHSSHALTFTPALRAGDGHGNRCYLAVTTACQVRTGSNGSWIPANNGSYPVVRQRRSRPSAFACAAVLPARLRGPSARLSAPGLARRQPAPHNGSMHAGRCRTDVSCSTFDLAECALLLRLAHCCSSPTASARLHGHVVIWCSSLLSHSAPHARAMRRLRQQQPSLPGRHDCRLPGEPFGRASRLLLTTNLTCRARPSAPASAETARLTGLSAWLCAPGVARCRSAPHKRPWRAGEGCQASA